VPETFDASVELPPAAGIVDQRVWLPERARGCSVLHLGCVDDRLTEQRAGTGTLLHEQLAATAKRLVGVDISAPGLVTLERLVPGEYIHGDVERLDQLDLPTVDLVIAAEIIEHLGSPGAFLTTLRGYLERTGATALITTPNALGWRLTSTFVARRREVTHPDHRLLYSPATLARTIELAGLELQALWSHTWRSGRHGLRSLVIDGLDAAALRWSPWLGVGLIAEVTARPPASTSS